MGALDYLFQGRADPAVQMSSAGGTNVPDWYNQYTQGIAARATSLADRAASQPVPQQSVAGFTPDQQQAFAQIRANQGNYVPSMAQAQGLTGAAPGAATRAAGAANTAVAGPAGSWVDPGVAEKYMSPYTSAVVNEIARLGNQNFSENVMPMINSSMIGSGQFGSTRNADVLGRAGRDVQQNISGQQASALESGYGTAAGIFGTDANRAQQQQAAQASTALAGGQLEANTGLQAGQQMGALGAALQQMGLTDAQALQASGQQQQQLQQLGLDTAYNNLVGANNYDWTTLNNMSSLVRGQQLPTTQTATTSGPLTRTYQQAPLSALTSGVAGIFGS